MLRLLPAPAAPVRAVETPKLSICAAPARGLVYTLLRHGHGLSHEESGLRLREVLRTPPDGPVQAA